MSQRRVSHSQSRPSASRQVIEDDEEDLSFTLPSSSQVQRGMDRLTSAEVDRKVAEVVQFILIKDQKKVPIKRADIIKNVIKENRNIYPEIMKKVNMTFEKVFGLKLVEIDVKNHAFILVNNLEQVTDRLASMNPAHPKTGLLFVILSVIFMKGGAVKEAVVWNTLKKLRVDPGERHEEFGDVKKLLTDEFVRQKYLEYARIPHTDPPEHEFRWGLRAESEVSKTRLLEFVAQLHEKEPQNWPKQYKEATTSDARSSQAS
ncbi:necdin-like 2 [Paramormyrops kingsleyae]|uniref:Necdin-like 2 n=1 Tax=Paramormyrops kingsleyae TaxID=1676925 RepID=A0A3B3RVI7_9TELE|nr:non-structural maintenance of chromosomes element 3 homolog [Paramormyrops kingsleyae]XP_023693106.1 non-structural maintenance of chromosomes element 3 homolog [Paramormyrops kingsleyae]XP_023693107.1 non-structural maintenance of chromosomes element 3 homolog [Paramormyrops kingsleyae]XP_023693108.1 non-structural maintenance of chromosomes element 3 homolog [Paramormyrops kingsleyae]